MKQLANEEAVSRNDNSRRETFDALEERRMSRVLQMSQDVITVGGIRVIDGDSFYDRGRWIDDEQRYLVFLTPGPDGNYAIDPVDLNSLIHMDEEIDAVIMELRSL